MDMVCRSHCILSGAHVILRVLLNFPASKSELDKPEKTQLKNALKASLKDLLPSINH